MLSRLQTAVHKPCYTASVADVQNDLESRNVRSRCQQFVSAAVMQIRWSPEAADDFESAIRRILEDNPNNAPRIAQSSDRGQTSRGG
jgi:hypothetical protein